MKITIVLVILSFCYCGPHVLGQAVKCKCPHRYIDVSNSLGEALRNEVFEVNNDDVDNAVSRNLVQNNPSRHTQFERESILDQVTFKNNKRLKAYNCSESVGGCTFIASRLLRSQLKPEPDSSDIMSLVYEIARRKKLKSKPENGKEEAGDTNYTGPRLGRSQFKPFLNHVPRTGTQLAFSDYVNLDDNHFADDDYQG